MGGRHAVAEQLAEPAPLHPGRARDPDRDRGLADRIDTGPELSLDQAVQTARTGAETTGDVVVDRAVPVADGGLVEDPERGVVLDQIPVLVARLGSGARRLSKPGQLGNPEDAP